MKIGIIGVGVVGGALRTWLKNNTDHEVLCIDPPKGMHASLEKAEAIFICVPVMNKTYGPQDLSALENAIEIAGIENPYAPIFVKSTILPGTADKLGVYHLPEFLTERTRDSDFEAHPIISGCNGKHKELLKQIFPEKEFLFMTNVEAEIAKYTHNVFAAMKVWYFNTIYRECERKNANYANVLAAARISGFIEKQHTQVPGPDGKLGFGGKCLPKDLRAWYNYLKFAPAGEIFADIYDDNEKIRSRCVAT